MSQIDQLREAAQKATLTSCRAPHLHWHFDDENQWSVPAVSPDVILRLIAVAEAAEGLAIAILGRAPAAEAPLRAALAALEGSEEDRR